MKTYDVFGVRLDSEIELPELEITRSPATTETWRFLRGTKAAPSPLGAVLGTDVVYGDVRVTAFGSPGMRRLVFGDTGTFDIALRSRTITWVPREAPPINTVRADLLGRVMALALHATGCLVLHASAVAIDGRAVAIVGPKGAGKSTLAMALVQHGARLITDDTLVLQLDGDRFVAAPGVQRVRLWNDSARALGAATVGGVDAKPEIDPLPDASRQGDVATLDACYVLRHASPNADLRRERLSAVHAAVACVGFSKLGALAAGEDGVLLLDRCARLANALPVYTADVPRELGRLQHAASALYQWHSASLPWGSPNAALVR